jgi:hypothetical protein
MPSRIQSNQVSTTSPLLHDRLTNQHNHHQLQQQSSTTFFTAPTLNESPTDQLVTSSVQTISLSISTLLHCSRKIYTPPASWTSVQPSTLIINPLTYFSNVPSFNLPSMHFFVAILCHLPGEHHKYGCKCILLRGQPNYPKENCLGLLITNVSKTIDISVPGFCDVVNFFNNPLLHVEICHVKINPTPLFTITN